MIDAPPPARARLDRAPRRRLHGGRNLTKAVVDAVEIDGGALAVKDFAPRPWLVRRFLGPWQLDREERAYRRLAGAGVPGVPRFLGRIDARAIALELVAGRPLAACRRGELTVAFFDRLDRVIEAIHAAGVAHGDIHRHDVLVGPDGSPRLLDFSTAVVLDGPYNPLRTILFRQMCRADRRSAAKLRQRMVPGAADPPSRPWLYVVGAALRRLARPGSRR